MTVQERPPEPSPSTAPTTRRRFLKWGFGGSLVVILGGAGGIELVSHHVLPGGYLLEQVDGACSVPLPPEHFAVPGPTYHGSFFSRERRRQVSFTVAYPPGHDRGDERPLCVYLHPWGGNHLSTYGGLRPGDALALRDDGRLSTPMAMVAADGGRGYWHPMPGDNSMGMVVHELVPMMAARGLGRRPGSTVITGISMGGYGSIVLAEKHPELFSAVAAISPAIWTSWPEAHNANPTAYSSKENFNAYDAVSHTEPLAGKPVRVASGIDDPFHPGVVALARALPPGAVVVISNGCHNGPFFGAQVPPSLAFLSRHLRKML